MKRTGPVISLILGLVSWLDASPFLAINLMDAQADPFDSLTHGLTNDEWCLEAKYERVSSPGADFIAYRNDCDVPVPVTDSGKLLELNTFRASQKVVWNAKAFHLRSIEKNHGITVERQRLLSSDGVLVDYYPGRPSAYIRTPDHVSSHFNLIHLLGMLPSGLSSLKDPVRPAGWKSLSEFAPFLIESGTLEEVESGYTFTFFKRLEEFSSGAGYSYALSFQKHEDFIYLSSIEVAIVGDANPQLSGFRRPVWRTELMDPDANGFPHKTHTRIWRYRKNAETNEYRQYLVREIKCSIQSIGVADEDYDFSLQFDVGTFVTDEMTGSKYRVGNPLGSQLDEVTQ
ncbi:hypothetical protein [Coraliomargarita parva]|uniref:hypothetical protein n=1 Tax=Coraliomargarita parva TaxID=3014050 RepID=UPI0022B2DAE0|nr:hypothetical protein [Coraliomargarita parva]